MRVQDLHPGWRTDFILHRYGAQVIERADCLVVRTPVNPTYYWGNCLILPRAPADTELAHWLGRFEQEITDEQPASKHVAIGINQAWADEDRPAWRSAGFDLLRHHLLALGPGELVAPARAARGETRLRAVDPDHDSEAVIALEATDAGSFEPEGYRAYLRAQWQRYRRMHADGLLQWFGLWCDGALAASCGLIRTAARPGADARFQRVITHPAWRRRGLASALVHGVGRYAFDTWGAARVYMVADPADVAIGIYRSLGWRDVAGDWSLQRNAPADRRVP